MFVVPTWNVDHASPGINIAIARRRQPETKAVKNGRSRSLGYNRLAILTDNEHNCGGSWTFLRSVAQQAWLADLNHTAHTSHSDVSAICPSARENFPPVASGRASSFILGA